MIDQIGLSRGRRGRLASRGDGDRPPRHGGTPAAAAPRVGYAMAIAAALLFAVNGSRLEGRSSRRRRSSSLRLTELRSTGAFVGLAGVLALTAPGPSAQSRATRLRLLVFYGIVGFALVQWLYFVAIERLPIGIGLLLEFTAPVLVALWARFVWHEPVRRRVWAALALALAGLALVARCGRTCGSTPSASRRAPRRGVARDLLPDRRACRRHGATPISLVCLSLGVAALVLGGRPAVVELPVRRARRQRVAPGHARRRRARPSGCSASG